MISAATGPTWEEYGLQLSCTMDHRRRKCRSRVFKPTEKLVQINSQVEGSKAQSMNLYSVWKSKIAQSYGRKQGFVLHLLSEALCFAGAYRRYERVDWPRVKRLMFICKGNICRSPYCEGRARSFGLEALSRGLETQDGRSPDPVVAAAGKCRGVDLSLHSSVPFLWSEVRAGDLLIPMEPAQARWLQASRSESTSQITLLGLWSQPRRPYIQDPLGLKPEYVETCLTILDSAITNIADRLKSCDGK